jgi:hypothetical protein
LAATAGAVTGAALSAAATAAAAYYVAHWSLEGLSRLANGRGYEENIARKFAEANGAKFGADGIESYRGSSEAGFYASRARAKKKEVDRNDAASAGLTYAQFEAAKKSRANSQRPANRASTQNRVARETRDAIRGAT